MANEDGSTAEETAADSAYIFGQRYVDKTGGKVSIDWSFLDQGLRGVLYAVFLSIIGVITGAVRYVEEGVASVTVGISSFFANWGLAADITASFATAQRSLSVFPPWFQFIAALGVVLLATWTLDKIRTVIADA